ncbi:MULTISPECIES: CoA-acylating methylmalonate-semialdehyde dehydrogenase [Mycobacteriaceae]|uniref:CoA-acylating methylmalonate-semialdehyde dehydrogenase n=1 Tax=Mycolicibacterium parafortuitum TaxID=39692 RepID=A0ACC6MPR2_MYCPF|nr:MULTISPECIES: CoA-acylating methylmalonate-semialdehyde dehydrogenase [Mycobacteriaceae]MDZ5088998.1 CoA-acylating methylmalonate-semialdehyde dehydrogenase [Mycolicibacterium parafortuitum]
MGHDRSKVRVDDRKACTVAPQVISHWVDNEVFTGSSGATAPVTNPATGEVTGQVALATVEDARGVIDAAAAAFPEWRDTSLAKRTAVLFRFRELLNERKDELAAIITAEHGKVLSDALGEVSRGQEVVEFACGIPHLLKGGYTENASTNIDVHSIRQPLGVVGIISPFNFPAMVPMWFFPLAIACGNTVVLKPSEKDPSAALWLAELWKEAGLPAGVFNVLQGDKTAVDELLTNPTVKSVSFVGSTPIAQYVYATGTAAGKRVQALGGAKNHAVILPDADLDLAADAMVNAGFGSAGERCMAISAAVAVGPIADDLVAKIAERAATIKTGDGTKDSDMGPLVTQAHRDKVASYIDAGEADGAKVVLDGRQVAPDGGQDGFWLGPTLLDNVTPAMSVYTDEIFGPVLSVVRVDTYDEALELINTNPYGNGTAIFTNDGGAARRFQNEVQVGMVGINVPIPVPMAYYSFGGWKNSLFGDSHAHGMDGVQFFTRQKAITTRWLDPSHGGLNLGFPQNA